jgi:hypothetical protein
VRDPVFYSRLQEHSFFFYLYITHISNIHYTTHNTVDSSTLHNTIHNAGAQRNNYNTIYTIEIALTSPASQSQTLLYVNVLYVCMMYDDDVIFDDDGESMMGESYSSSLIFFVASYPILILIVNRNLSMRVCMILCIRYLVHFYDLLRHYVITLHSFYLIL